MAEKRRILVALSGGVDSSVAAALLAREGGHQLVGVNLKLAPDGASGQCCGLDGVARARQVCARMDIPFTVVDASDLFRKTVIDPFVSGYANGLTPNPCVACNRHVKFDYLFEVAKRLGFDDVATGHYARIEDAQLKRAVDAGKDQSYALYMLTHDKLSRLHFPLGGFPKSKTREIAQELGLATAHTPESMDICFVGPDHGDFLEKEHPGIGVEGDIVDLGGKVLGRHRGLHRYTLGQRQGLGVGGVKGREGAWFVIALDRDNNRLLVGDQDQVGQDEILVSGVSTTLPGNNPEDLPRRVRLQVRYGKQTCWAALEPANEPGLLKAIPETPVVSAPGQAAVFYDENDERVLGGGTVMKVVRRSSPEVGQTLLSAR